MNGPARRRLLSAEGRAGMGAKPGALQRLPSPAPSPRSAPHLVTELTQGVIDHADTGIPGQRRVPGKHSSRSRSVSAGHQAGARAGGLQGVPVMALRRTSMTLWPCLRAVSI
jgi:hypothetical protein